LSVGLGTLHALQALASHLLPSGAFGWYGPNSWYPKGSELPAVSSLEIGQEQRIWSSRKRPLKPGIFWPWVLLKQNPPSHWP